MPDSSATSSRTLWIIGGVLTVALGALAYAGFEVREEEEWVGLRGEARGQPMLAAGRMLRRMGIDAREASRADWPPADDPDALAPTTLLVWNPPRQLDGAQARALTQWVHDGGHLLTTTSFDARARFVAWVFAGGVLSDVLDDEEGEEDGVDPAVDAATDNTPGSAPDKSVDLTRKAFRMTGTPSSAEDDDPAAGDDASIVKWRPMIESLHGHVPLDAEVHGARARRWVPVTDGDLVEPLNTATDPGACRPVFAARGEVTAATCQVGRGRLTLVDQADGFLNHRFGRHGHAEALATLVLLEPAGLTLIDLGLGDARPLLSWAVGRAPIALVLTLVGVLALVWSRARRLGPAHDIAAPRRRALAEHLSSAGQFAWRHDRGQQLARRLHDAVQDRAAQAVPGWRRLDDAARATALAAIVEVRGHTAMPPDAIARALAPPPEPSGRRPKESGRDYTARVRTLNTLWRALDARHDSRITR